MWSRAVPALLSLLILSCGTPLTQLVAVVSSDLTGVTAIRVRSLRADADVEEELSSVVVRLEGGTALPVAVAVEPFDLMDIGRVIVEAEAQNAMGQRIVARRATTEFREGEQLALPLSLRESCRRVMCPSGNTCGEMGCATQEVPVSSLTSFEGVVDAP
ncbi:MAG: hypothetical protein H6719_15695 [Sandaracinaceae bacterium]|nr:hypothetical protein [Sandaracinaceae bacterium]